MARRVFLGLTDVAGYFSSLESGLQEIGIDARLFDLSANVVGYGLDATRSRGRLRTRFVALSSAPPRTLRRFAWDSLLFLNRAVRRVRGIALLPWAIVRFDTFILAGGGMFLDGRELPILRRLGKRVVVVFTGSDHRPPYLNGIWVRDAQVAGYRAIRDDVRSIKARVGRAEASATAIVALAASAQFHERPFAEFLRVGYPFRAPATASVDPPAERTSAEVRILHCPTRPVEKGSARIRAAVTALQAEGFPIAYRELSGRPHADVLAALEWCDFVVDEVYSDSPMAGFSTEAAGYARPAVVAGYGAPHDGAMAQTSGMPPSLFVVPDQLETAIERLVTDASARRRLGQQANEFVTREWSPSMVAQRILRLADGERPAEWMVDPATVTYVHGWGMDSTLLVTGVHGLVAAYGESALGLDARADLRDRLLAIGSVT
jgi:hypothetical protein